jgi:hypothetical protein
MAGGNNGDLLRWDWTGSRGLSFGKDPARSPDGLTGEASLVAWRGTAMLASNNGALVVTACPRVLTGATEQAPTDFGVLGSSRDGVTA